MSILPSGLFGRRHEPTRHHIWDPYQDHGLVADRTTPHLAFPSETSPIANVYGNTEWKETPEAYVCKIHLPGLKRSDVRVEVDDGRVLCIICEKSVEKEVQRRRWHRLEVSRGHFAQRFTLPENVNVDRVKAYMDDGVLTITVPKHHVVNHHVRNINIYEH